jgi:hypothetical protein
MTFTELTEFFKWMTIISVSLLFLSTFLVIAFKNSIFKLHSKLFGIKKADLVITAYGYLGVFKLLIIMFNIVPYLALLLMK